ncbi:hypothetical protein EYF80_022834 [Liparis tanakae]|uniref:Uncharacterized protein n=1 Tax=Liparis tanakae TaxID=230148 RepID=A0A4Z2HME0_9TELE|nr:hypothetical protein EYF80_022834 [Liparis tanakae]
MVVDPLPSSVVADAPDAISRSSHQLSDKTGVWVGISPRVILWAAIIDKQAASGSNYRCRAVIRSQASLVSFGDADVADFTPEYREDEATQTLAEPEFGYETQPFSPRSMDGEVY